MSTRRLYEAVYTEVYAKRSIQSLYLYKVHTMSAGSPHDVYTKCIRSLGEVYTKSTRSLHDETIIICIHVFLLLCTSSHELNHIDRTS